MSFPSTLSKRQPSTIVRRQEKDKGFSLVELLVVVAILAVLAAIAIPIFLNQKQKSMHAVVKNDIRSLIVEVKTVSTPGTTYAGTLGTDLTASKWSASAPAKNDLWFYRVYKNCSTDTSGTAISATSQGVVAPVEFVIIAYKINYANYRALYDSHRGQWIENGVAFNVFTNINAGGAPCVASWEDF